MNPFLLSGSELMRWWRVLLLLFALQPAPLAAQPGVLPTDEISAVPHPSSGAARAETGLDGLRALDRGSSEGPTRSGNGPSHHADRRFAGPEVLKAAAAPIAPPLVRVGAPLCEHLPYDCIPPPRQHK